MMIEYRLHFRSPLIGSLDSDTLMGAMAWAMIRTSGEEALVSWIEKCRDGQPPFVTSNGFPTGFFPIPSLLPANRVLHANKTDRLKMAKENKQLKNRRWIPTADFLRVLQGHTIALNGSEPEPFAGKQIHAIIDRSTGKSLEQNGLYETSFSGYSQLSVFVRVLHPEWKQIVDRMMQYLEIEGIGARKSTGNGQFQILSRQEFKLPALEASNGYIVLSNFIPSAADARKGRYRLKTKYGKMAEEYSKQGTPFKKPLLMIESGACFYQDSPKLFCGRLVTGVAPQRPEVVQFCYGLTVPAQLPVEGESVT